MADLLDRLKAALADRYRIERELGSGGMATVYLAHDVKHDRKVAFKVMRPELSAILGGERFLREIRIAAKLNHPHILPLHDSGEVDSFLYYVMPHVEGESLRVKLNREKQLSVDDTISITKQVGAGLDYAHRQGVIHRDIKPENILIHQGEALVADFGIALAVSAAGGTRLTDTGLSLGTPEYMSPEQATGERELDARSDMYSLGVVVYEMLVGEPPHTGKTVQAIIAKVVSAEPQPVSRVRHSVPSNVDAAVMCALAKTPADRFASGADFADALTNPAFALPTPAGVVPVPQREGPRSKLTVLAFPIAVIATLLAFWGWLRSPPESPKPVTRISIRMPEGEEVVRGQGTDIALSPDGSRLVYVGPGETGRRLWLRRLDQLHATPLPGSEGAFGPFFSPDGEAVGFHDGQPGPLKIVSVAGLPPATRVALVPRNSGDWGPDDMLYFGALSGGISRVRAAGGEPEVVTTPDTAHGGLWHDRVDVLPNGKGALFTIWRGSVEDADVAAVEFRTGEVRVLVRGLDPQYARSGHLVYVRSDSVLSAAPFDQDNLLVTGPTTPLIEGVRCKSGGAAQFALSETGTLVYGTGGRQLRQAVLVDREGVEREVDPDWADRSYDPVLSPDGTRLAVAVDGPDGRHIWIKTLDRGPLSRLTFEGDFNVGPTWTPDGLSVTFSSERAGQETSDIWIKRADGVGSAEVLLDIAASWVAGVWSPDRSWFVYSLTTAVGQRDIFAWRAGPDSLIVPVAAAAGVEEHSPALSPDGQWLAYVSNETGRWEVWVRPFPDVEAGRWQVSARGGTEPVWAHSGGELFYKSGHQELVVAEVVSEPAFRVEMERPLFSVADYYSRETRQQYAVGFNDQRFVMLRKVETEDFEWVLVLNFFEELKQRVGNGND
jgi:serine/threonine-protein kinase